MNRIKSNREEYEEYKNEVVAVAELFAELDQCATAEDARKLYAECSAARELTKEIAEQITAAGRVLAHTEKSDEGEVVEATLVDEETGEVKAA